ncbi:16S rRNA (guanine(966)-N(2))-methyltransferase RsmD [Sphingobacterium sp. DN00404]|uniref:16S rRNA (Guanine(966)-N(2))-methyltransferase RsmD n=1 Tax=Sphingobacterium micropteri TaxID=2763501 RepID=A0ABR7YQG5_9SPHI|nr:16S rRNA (guanine(966)-N(2))-methyltransferase RsmD [Sphingobacterium micropteri]MBD1433578.1 16S rRNA (guanine(966)-N(2))-methyltransferase RsmD [Sphingobacterium micropteri]
MRIIGGKYGGLRLSPPANLPVRPTTDIAKEALFNILDNRIALDECDCLDLFAGTGNISFELASRGALSVESVDIHFKCLQFIKDTAKKLHIEVIRTRKADVLKFIAACKNQYDFIFADPPYDLPSLPQLANLILEKGLLKPGGTMVIEHPSTRKMDESPFYIETRKYGYSSFSFFKLDS